MADDRLIALRKFTPARIALARSGGSLSTADWLELRSAHAAARDAVHAGGVAPGWPPEWHVTSLRSRCRDRREYLLRPDLGRRLHADANLRSSPSDLCVVAADGLAPAAVSRHAVPLLEQLLPRLTGLVIGPLVQAEFGRVAIGDDIGQRIGARAVLVLIGERPGLSSPDSMGAYLTYAPAPGRTDAERNCLSNIREEGLDYSSAARRLEWLIREALSRQLTGVDLKEATSSWLPSTGMLPGCP